MPGETNFDFIAPLYRVLEYATMGWALERCRFHFLPQLDDRRRALVLGDGDGRFLAKLLATQPYLQADAVDTSAAMLHLLVRRCGAAGDRLRTHLESALDHSPAPDADMVVAHFFFDCLTQPELDRLVQQIATRIRPDALWLVSDFRIPGGLMRWPARLLVGTLYFAFRLLTGLRVHHLPDHAVALQRAGLTLRAQHRTFGGILTTELWSWSRTSVQ